MSETPVVGGMKFDDVDLPGAKKPEAQQQQADEKKPKKVSQFWANVGIERGGKLLTLPMGIALDDLKAKKIPNSTTKNQEFRNLRIAEKQFWDSFQAQLASFKPGESRKVNLVVEVRRIADNSEVTEEEITENPFAVGDFTL